MQTTRTESGPTLRYGFVVELDEARCRVRVRWPDLDGLISYWLRVPQAKTHHDKHYSLPDVGEHVACLLDAHGEDGLVLGAIYGQRDAAPAASAEQHHIRFADGTAIDYDRRSGRLYIDCVGDVEIVSRTRIRLIAPRIDLN